MRRRRGPLLLGSVLLVAVVIAVAAVVTWVRGGDEDGGPGRVQVTLPEPPAPDCTLFAAPDGDDTNPGSADAPLRTAEQLVKQLPAGGVGCLRAGRYEQRDLGIETDGVTLRSASGERATLAVGTLAIEDSATGVTVRDLDIVGTSDDVTVRAVGDRFLLTRNDISNNNEGSSCVLVGSQDHSALGGRIVGNVVHNCGEAGSHLDHGIYAQHFGPATEGEPGLLIEGNLLYAVSGYSVQLYPVGIDAVVRGNVIDGGGLSVRGGIVIDGEVAEGHLIEHNVITDTRSAAILQRTGSGHVSRGNCFSGNESNIDGSEIRSDGDDDSSDCAEDLAAEDAALAQAIALQCGACPADRCEEAEDDELCQVLAR